MLPPLVRLDFLTTGLSSNGESGRAMLLAGVPGQGIETLPTAHEVKIRKEGYRRKTVLYLIVFIMKFSHEGKKAMPMAPGPR
jgi:hypothetical protein